MSERLSAAEVVAELRERGNAMRRYRSAGSELSSHLDEAADLVESHLVPQWQAEPTGDGLCHVQGPYQDWPVMVFDDRDSAGWWVHGWYVKDCEWVEVYEPLDRRRVCPISGPPSDEKGGA